MMNIKVETPNLPESKSFKDLILSLLKKAFSKKPDIKSVLVVVSINDDVRTPYSVEMNLEEENEAPIQTKAASANSLAAFSQALKRMERQLDKRRA